MKKGFYERAYYKSKKLSASKILSFTYCKRNKNMIEVILNLQMDQVLYLQSRS